MGAGSGLNKGKDKTLYRWVDWALCQKGSLRQLRIHYALHENRGRHYLQCSNRRVSKEACTGAFISVEKLERIVVQELNRLSAQYLDQDKLERNLEFSSSLLAQRQKVLDQRSKYQAQHEEFQTGLRELYLDKVRGILSESDFLSLSRDFSKEKELIEWKIAEINRRLEEMDARMAAGDNRRELVQRYANLEHLMIHRDPSVSQEELMEHVLESDANPFSNVVRMHISSLRKKLRDKLGYDPIQTKVGQGYRLAGEEPI